MSKAFSKRSLKTKILVLVLVAIAIFLFLPIKFGRESVRWRYADLIKEDQLYKVKKVLDGDTFVVIVSRYYITVRLIGIDTPEVVDPKKPVQCFGPEASMEAKRLLSGKKVYLKKEKTKGNYDVYGRVLAYAELENGVFYNQYMVEEGFAREYTFNEEKYKYQEEFKKAEEKAKEGKKGLWSKCPI